MSLKVVYCGLIVTLALTSLLIYENQEFFQGVLEKTSTILFGDIWRFGEFCGHRKDVDNMLASDTEAQGFYNGSKLEALETVSKPEEIMLGLDQLNYLGIRSRNSYNLACSVNSWGYADKSSYELSNLPYNNSIECHSMIDDLYASVRYLIERIPLETSRSSSNFTTLIMGHGSHKSEETRLIIKRWLQLNNFGRVPAGPLQGVHHWLGDFDGCIRDTSMRYCYGAYRMAHWPRSIWPEMNAFKVGVCLPRSCDDDSVNSLANLKKIDQLIKYNLIRSLDGVDDNKYHLIALHCPPAVDSPFLKPSRDLLSTVLIMSAIVWLAMIIYFNLIKFSENTDNISRSFDLKLIWARFTYNQHIAVELSGLNAIKVISMIWLMSSHIFIYSSSYLQNLQLLRDTWRSSYGGAVLLQAQHGVSLFFIISGLLAGLKKTRMSSLSKFKLIRHRYIRLLPMYLIVYAFVKKFAHIMGSGPMWDYGVSIQSENRQCMKESWLVPILMLSNFIHPFSHCILTGWHIANDFQIFLVLPFIFDIYRKSRLSGNIISLSIFILTHLYHILNFSNADNFPFETFSREPVIVGPRILLSRLAYDYVNPMGRVGTYLLGVVLGDVLFGDAKSKHRPQIDQIEKSNQSSEIKAQGDSTTNTKLDEKENKASIVDSSPEITNSGKFKDKLSFVVAIILLGVGIFSSAGPDSLKQVFGSYSKPLAYPFCRFVVELGWFCLLYSFLSSRGLSVISNKSGQQQKPDTIVYRFLASPVWNILVKLNYSLMLTHFTVVRYILVARSHLLVFNKLNLFQMTTFTITMCYIVSGFVHLIIEMPLTSLVNLLPLS